MNGKDVDKSEGEHHVVKTQGGAAKPKCSPEHPETEKPAKTNHVTDSQNANTSVKEHLHSAIFNIF